MAVRQCRAAHGPRQLWALPSHHSCPPAGSRGGSCDPGATEPVPPAQNLGGGCLGTQWDSRSQHGALPTSRCCQKLPDSEQQLWWVMGPGTFLTLPCTSTPYSWHPFALRTLHAKGAFMQLSGPWPLEDRRGGTLPEQPGPRCRSPAERWAFPASCSDILLET